MKTTIILFILFSICSIKVYAVKTTDHIITFFIQPYPVIVSKTAQKIQKTTQTLGKIPSKILQAISKTNDGIFSTYYGYLTVSNFNGQITFPREALQKPILQLLITPEIKPIYMIDNTIHHWETIDTLPKAWYSIERKQDDETKLYYWDVQKITNPKNIVTINTIVLYAKPKNIFVPTGISLSNDNPQLILPTIYVRKQLNRITPALLLLKVRQFFGPIQLIDKKQSPTYYSSQITMQ